MTQTLRRMAEATRLTRAGLLSEATALLQGALGATPPHAPPSRAEGPIIDAVLDHGRFIDGSFGNATGKRPYKLFVPAGATTGRALLVMLHGCTQSPDDFAAGTRMNEIAAKQDFLVLYPQQTQSANMQRCWNWFNAADQARGAGEAGLVADMTRAVVAEFGVDPRRIYVAGLSAGGAAAAVLGAAYPDLFAAVGVHSGLACGAATNMQSAFAAMRDGQAGQGRSELPTIVFHGDRDSTVNPVNGDAVVAQAGAAGLTARAVRGRATGGHSYTRTVHADSHGRAILEQWLVHGSGHAWSGGSPAGSFTDPSGPDASREMVRFFLEHPRATGV